MNEKTTYAEKHLKTMDINRDNVLLIYSSIIHFFFCQSQSTEAWVGLDYIKFCILLERQILPEQAQQILSRVCSKRYWQAQECDMGYWAGSER